MTLRIVLLCILIPVWYGFHVSLIAMSLQQLRHQINPAQVAIRTMLGGGILAVIVLIILQLAGLIPLGFFLKGIL